MYAYCPEIGTVFVGGEYNQTSVIQVYTPQGKDDIQLPQLNHGARGIAVKYYNKTMYAIGGIDSSYSYIAKVQILKLGGTYGAYSWRELNDLPNTVYIRDD